MPNYKILCNYLEIRQSYATLFALLSTMVFVNFTFSLRIVT